MYARSTTIQGQPSSIDAGIAHTRDSVMPALEGIDGCVGLSLLVDRTSGRCIVTSSWDSEEAMHASEESIRPIRDRAVELFGGSRQVEEWEIAAMHREHRAAEGACAQVTWVKVDADQMDRGIDFYKMTILPALEELEGFCSASLLVDRAFHAAPLTIKQRLCFYSGFLYYISTAVFVLTELWPTLSKR